MSTDADKETEEIKNEAVVFLNNEFGDWGRLDRCIASIVTPEDFDSLFDSLSDDETKDNGAPSLVDYHLGDPRDLRHLADLIERGKINIEVSPERLLEQLRQKTAKAGIFVCGTFNKTGEVATWCADCMPDEVLKNIGEPFVDTWTEGSDGWLKAPVCQECKISMLVYCDGERKEDDPL